MHKVILGIHGLGNKPPRRLLRTWWKRALNDGLKKIEASKIPLPFELVYWADILHPIPEDPTEKDPQHPLFLDETYAKPPADTPKPASYLKEKLIESIGRNLGRLFLNEDYTLNFTFLTDRIIQRYFSEFEAYYSQMVPAEGSEKSSVRELIRTRLLKRLRRHRNKAILLIAHSMGSLIAFDVLFTASLDETVDTVVTIGSPLGLPVVMHRIYAEHFIGKKDITLGKIRCPESIKSAWFNFSDIEDKIALEHRLYNDFQPNIHGVQPVDSYVVNDYMVEGVRNPHKDYGYLRTPELARVLVSFLEK